MLDLASAKVIPLELIKLRGKGDRGLNDKQIMYFINVVELQSLNKAEKRLYVSRQALKKQIDSLEAELGFDLFVRTPQGTSLTPVGEEFYQGIKGIREQIDALTNRCRGLYNHECVIKIGAPSKPRLILEKAFIEFSKQYPHIKQNVVFMNEAKSLDLVLDGTVDVAECILYSNVDKSKIGFFKLADLPYKCLLLPTHPLAGKKEIHLSELDGNTVGLRQSGNVQLIHKLKEECRNITLLETPGSQQMQQQIFTICYNQGVFISRAHSANHMEPLVTVPLVTDITSECYVIYKKPCSPIARKFIDMVKTCYPIEE